MMIPLIHNHVRRVVLVLALFGSLALPVSAATNRPPLFFVQISDTHRGKPIHAQRLAAVISQINALPQPIQFVIHTGDFASDDLRTETASVITNQLAQLRVPLFTVAGNHDILPRRLDETLATYTNYIGPLAYRREVQGVQFLMVYTEPLRKGFTVPGYDPIGWVEAQLRAHPDLETIIFTHAPVDDDFYNNRIHPGWPEAVRQAWLAALRQGRVQAIVAGHFHRDELHWNELGIPTYVASSIADFWGRQATFRVYCYAAGRLSYSTVYIED